jgi:ribonuclease T1
MRIMLTRVIAFPEILGRVVAAVSGRLRGRPGFLVASLLAATVLVSGADLASARGPATLDTIQTSRLPAEARDTLATIRRGGPYRYRQDDSTFGNRERLLPSQPRGYYREYTVVTPGSRDRGARRIVAGGQPPEVFYYTDDHYRSFRRITD